MNPVLSHPHLRSALVMHMCAVGAIIGGRTTIDLVFLSSYPTSWLPYFYLAQAGIVAILLSYVKSLARGVRSRQK